MPNAIPVPTRRISRARHTFVGGPLGEESMFVDLIDGQLPDTIYVKPAPSQGPRRRSFLLPSIPPHKRMALEPIEYPSPGHYELKRNKDHESRSEYHWVPAKT